MNVLPENTYTFKGESSKAMKVNKQRITTLLSANMDGSSKVATYCGR
jgi:hypothetical protein